MVPPLNVHTVELNRAYVRLQVVWLSRWLDPHPDLELHLASERHEWARRPRRCGSSRVDSRTSPSDWQDTVQALSALEGRVVMATDNSVAASGRWRGGVRAGGDRGAMTSSRIAALGLRKAYGVPEMTMGSRGNRGRMARGFRRVAGAALAVVLLAGVAAPGLAAAESPDAPLGVAGRDRPELQEAIQEVVDSGFAGVQLRVNDERGEWVGSAGVRKLGEGAKPPTNGRFGWVA